MPRVSRLKLPPLDAGGETIGDRVARLRKERGFTQMELAEKVGIIQTIVSAIEKGALKLSAEMAVRFAVALEISTDDLLMPARKRRKPATPSRKVLRRVEQIETLPAHHQQTVLKSLDMMLTGLKNAS
jgi:transcriptional regulator with XRE-family HTH domain